MRHGEKLVRLQALHSRVREREKGVGAERERGGGVVEGCSRPVSERSSLLYNFVKRKCYISSRPPFKNILELFGASFNKTRFRRS